MNCASRVLPHVREREGRGAVWTVADGQVSFGEFGRLAGAAQELARTEGLRTGDAALVLASPGPLFFSTVIGLLGMGVTVVTVEPWLPLAEVEQVLRRVAPRAFIGSRVAQLWAARVPAARSIPRWIHIGRARRATSGARFECVDLDPCQPATLTFSSGSTGRPKGFVRSHRCMWSLHEAITEGGRRDAFDAPELCVFPNLALLHLGTGRGAVLVPKKWSTRWLARLGALCGRTRPASLAAGPAFLMRLLRFTSHGDGWSGLRSITVGGAQTDCWILERCFERWPEARFTHIYGGSEAEPVALADAREAVERSRARGRFQTLYLGRPIPSLETDLDPEEGLRVRGPNVAERFGADRVRRWHPMGDRIVADEAGWWYAGRLGQRAMEFELEQRIYAHLGTSACFVHRDEEDRLILCGNAVVGRTASARRDFLARFPELERIRDVRIVRDRRHRARIDRRASLGTSAWGAS